MVKRVLVAQRHTSVQYHVRRVSAIRQRISTSTAYQGAGQSLCCGLCPSTAFCIPKRSPLRGVATLCVPPPLPKFHPPLIWGSPSYSATGLGALPASHFALMRSMIRHRSAHSRRRIKLLTEVGLDWCRMQKSITISSSPVRYIVLFICLPLPFYSIVYV